MITAVNPQGTFDAMALVVPPADPASVAKSVS